MNTADAEEESGLEQGHQGKAYHVPSWAATRRTWGSPHTLVQTHVRDSGQRSCWVAGKMPCVHTCLCLQSTVLLALRCLELSLSYLNPSTVVHRSSFSSGVSAMWASCYCRWKNWSKGCQLDRPPRSNCLSRTTSFKSDTRQLKSRLAASMSSYRKRWPVFLITRHPFPEL